MRLRFGEWGYSTATIQMINVVGLIIVLVDLKTSLSNL